MTQGLAGGRDPASVGPRSPVARSEPAKAGFKDRTVARECETCPMPVLCASVAVRIMTLPSPEYLPEVLSADEVAK